MAYYEEEYGIFGLTGRSRTGEGKRSGGYGRLIEFDAEPSQVLAGEPVMLAFTVSSSFDAQMVTIGTTDGELVYKGHPNGSVVVCPSQTTKYVLTVIGPALYRELLCKVVVQPSPGWQGSAYHERFSRQNGGNGHAAPHVPSSAWARQPIGDAGAQGTGTE
jgi:hypothetical protein